MVHAVDFQFFLRLMRKVNDAGILNPNSQFLSVI